MSIQRNASELIINFGGIILKYTPSKYNICVDDRKENILLFNSLHGTKSFLKVNKENDIIKCLDKEEIFPGNETTDVQMLINKGFIIPFGVDETENLRSVFDRRINSKQLNLIISPTEECNLRCQYCCESFCQEKMSKKTQESIIQFLEKNINQYNGINIDWFGGEPLLALEVIEYIASNAIRICNENRKPYSSFITTNGTLLTPSVFELLYKLKVLMYQVTLDGIAPVHDQQRKFKNGSPSFEVIFQNLSAIKETNVGKHAIISILTNYSEALKPYIKQYKHLMHESFGDDQRFAFACNLVMDLGGERIDQYRDELVDSRGMDSFYEYLINIDDIKMRYIFEEFLNPGGMLCYAARRNSFVVGSTGALYKCEHLFQQSDSNGIVGKFSVNGEMILDEKKMSQWIGKFHYCGNEDCKLLPLCLGEDCIKKRVFSRNENGNSRFCGYNLCHFQKKTMSSVLRFLDHERSLFAPYDL